MKTLQELNGYSKIIFKANTQTIADEVNKKFDFINSNRENLGIPLTECVLQVKNRIKSIPATMYIYYKLTNKCIYLESYLECDNFLGEYMFIPFYKGHINLINGKRIDDNITYEKKDVIIKEYVKQNKDKFRQLTLKIFADCISLINIVQLDKQTVYKESKGITYNTSNTKKKKSTNKNIQVLNSNNVVYTFKGTIEHSKQLKEYKRHTLGWDVVGHLRHYKNGKVAYVKPYHKGDKNVNNKKDYIVK